MAKNFNKSEYAINKFSEAIVYLGADGAYELTEAEFLRQNPGMTKEDFAFWKAWSDEDYKEELRAETEDKRFVISIHELEETRAVCLPSAEDAFIKMTETRRRRVYTIQDAEVVLSCLTETQRRRYLLRHQDGKTYREIAQIEHIDAMVAKRSIDAAEKKIKKFLRNF